MMARAIRDPWRWRVRLSGAAVLLLTLLAGLAGYTPAYADDRDDDWDDDEVVLSGPNACTAIADLPIYPNATCTKHSTERDDGGIETENHYATQDSVATVRRAYEAAFSQHGWTLVATEYDRGDQEREYTVTRGQRRVEVTIAAPRTAGAATAIEIEEE